MMDRHKSKFAWTKSGVVVAVLLFGLMTGCGRSETSRSAQMDAAAKVQDVQPASTEADSREVRAPSQSPIIWLLVFALLVVAATTSGTTWYLLRWRRRLPDGQQSVLPEEVLRAMDGLAQLNGEQIRNADQALNDVGKSFEEIRAGFVAFSKSASEKDEVIRRLRMGGDRQANIQLLRRFVRVARMVDEDIATDQAAGKDTSALESIRSHLEEALLDGGLTQFMPDLGQDYRTANGVSKNPQFSWGDEVERDWSIIGILQPGFQFDTGSEPFMVEPAIVEVYRVQKGDV